MGKIRILLAALAAILLSPPIEAQQTPERQGALEERLERIAAQLHPVTGDVRLPAANAILHLGDDYYFLPAEEARLVLTEAWGNPPEMATGVLGMVFPAGRTFADDTWGAVITYDASGYVSDEDAESTDYAELMGQLQSGEAEVNAERQRQGYPTQHLVGWAQTPAYDRRTHSVVWAQNIQFQGSPENTLNYDIRMLGRHGVLSLNMVTVMSKLAETRQAAQRFAAAAEFTQGARYADFQQGDRVAEYGVAGLIAASVGAAAAKKAGLIALLLAFAKKGFVLILAGLALIGGFFRRLFGRKEEEVYPEEPIYSEDSTDGAPVDSPDTVETIRPDSGSGGAEGAR